MNQFDADDLLRDPYLKLCAKYQVPAVFHSGPANSNSDPEKIYQVAKRHPSVAIILYHMGFGTDHQQAVDVVESALLKGDANLYLDTAQANPKAVLKAINTVGADRVLFGSDVSFFGEDHYQGYLPMLQLLKNQLSEEDFLKVVRENAKRLFLKEK